MSIPTQVGAPASAAVLYEGYDASEVYVFSVPAGTGVQTTFTQPVNRLIVQNLGPGHVGVSPLPNQATPTTDASDYWLPPGATLELLQMVVTLALNQYATADLPTTVRVSGLRPYNGG